MTQPHSTACVLGKTSMLVRLLGFLFLTLIAGLAADERVRAQEATPSQGTEVEAEVPTSPVEVDGTVLFRVRGVSSFPAPMRAGRIRDQVKAVASDPTVSLDAIRVVDSGGMSRILAGDVLIMGIVEADAAIEQVRRVELAEAHAGRIRQAVSAYRAARTRPALQNAAVSTLVATLLLAAAVVTIRWTWRWLDRVLTRRLQTRIHTVEIKSFEVMRAERIWSALRSGLFALRTVIFLVMALVYFGFALAQFPWTRGLSRDLAGFVLGPLQVMGQGIIGIIPSLVFLTVLFFVVRLGLRLVRLFFEAVGRGAVQLEGFDADWAEPTYKILRIAVVALALVVAYPYIPGSDSAAFKGVSLFMGILFSLGSSSAIANIIAGYMLTYRRALKVGDRVKIGDSIGDVVAVRLQVTHLRSFKNEEIIIPNSQILAGDVLNYSSLANEHGLILHTEVGIGYETPWRQVEAMLLTAAGRTDGLLTEPRPFVLLQRLGDFAVTYEINAFCRDVKLMKRLYTDLHRHILDVFNEYGVQIMTPAYEGDPAEPKVVPPKDWYTAPATAGPPTRPAEPGK